MSRSPHAPLSDAFGAAALGVGASLLACCVAVAVRSGSNERVSIAGMFAVGTVAIIALPTIAQGPGKLGGRAMAVSMFATLGWLPLMALLILFMQSPLAVVEHGARCGTGMVGLIFLVPLLLIPMLFASSGMATFARTGVLDRVFRVASISLLTVVAGVAAYATSQISRPDPDTYLAQVPTEHRIQVGEAFVIDGATVVYKEQPETRDIRAPAVAQWTLCTLDGLHERSGVPADISEHHEQGPCPVLRLRHDQKSELWIVDDGANHPIAFVTRGGEIKRELTERDVRASIAPPIAWTLGAILAVICGAAFIALSRRVVKGAARIGAIEGTHRGGGWVDLQGEQSVHFAALNDERTGPVLLCMRAKGRIPTYRESGANELALLAVASLEEWRAKVTGHAASLRAAAIVSMLLLTTPLFLYLLVLA